MESSSQPNSSSAAKLSVRQLRRRYFLALLLIAVLVIISQAMSQWLIASQARNASLINIAGRQRMLSQEITKLTFYILEASSSDASSRHRQKREETVRLWQRSHVGLMRGDIDMDLPGRNSVAVQQLFERVQPHHDAMLQAAWAILSSPAGGTVLAQSMQEIRRHEADFLTLINDLLDFEKITAGKLHLELQQQALQPLLEQAVESTQAFGERLHVGFHLDAPSDPIAVQVDGSRLQQVLVNLLSNAAQFSPAGEQVEISVSNTATSVRIAVTDHGPGIPDEFRPRIFQRFSQADSSDTRKQGGSGLGLAISKELVESMNGQIGFTSKVGEGSCFYLELPTY
jgi:signal transduction histidine kinase